MTDSNKNRQSLATIERIVQLENQGKHAFGPNTIVLFYAASMEGLAKQIAEEYKGDGEIVLGNVNFNRFADSFPNIFIENANCLKWTNVGFLSSLHAPDVIFEQLSAMYSLPRYMAKSFKVIVPFFPTGTMERVDQSGQVATAATMARLLSQIPMAANGPSQLMFFDIHTLQNQFYFSDDVMIQLSSCIPLLRLAMSKLPDRNNISVAFPDEGAFKRFHTLFGPDMEFVICTKVREGKKRIVKLKEGVVTDKHIVIVDDLVQSGGTLIECAKILQKHGAAKISCYVTHAIFPHDSWKKFVDNDLFANFWITNSHPTAQKLEGKEPFKVLSIAPLVAQYLMDH